MTVTVGSLCTGYGGLDAGLATVLPIELCWVAETDPACSTLLERHHPGVPNLGDITRIDWESTDGVDVLTAGFPCQPFSLAGQRKGTNDERHLWPHIADTIRVLRPRLVILENVAAHVGFGFDRVLADLAQLRFDAEWAVVRASEMSAAAIDEPDCSSLLPTPTAWLGRRPSHGVGDAGRWANPDRSRELSDLLAWLRERT